MGLRVGVIGAGVMGADHVRRLMDVTSGADVTLVSDADPGRLAAATAPYGLDGTTDPLAVVASDRVDAVVVASPDHTHAELTRACLAAGKPVLVEKPLADDVRAAESVVAAEVAGGRRLVQVGFMRRYDAGYVALRRAVRDGDLGRVLLVHNAHRNLTHAPGLTTAASITNSGVHEIDVLRWLTGSEYATGTTYAGARALDGGLRDPQFLVLTTADGAVCDVEVNQGSGYGYDIRCEIVFERGAVALASPHATTLRAGGVSGQPVQQHWTERFVDAYDAELQDWVEHAAAGTMSGTVTGASAWDGYVASAVAARLASAEPGVPVSLAAGERPDFYEHFYEQDGGRG